ncbi:RagB/SusD family nutrient uptake outer membrane protein [Desertivirga brevis]|uniref:RagB/SusD family nutrient uptake outer membrane protein n=1 Tax=Desertivirga brevis TaxID=2810310 RepID=UPI001A95C3EA|nr:RagB/SusD family nutrient uptake outer membrane protein [Pedobacter sp. SYSU D00873]
MKAIIYSLVIGALLITSCSKDDLNQEPISSATTSSFFQTNNDFIQGSNAVYASLRAYPDRLLNLSETRSDNLYAVSDGGVRDWEGINSFQKTIAGNPYVSEAWTANFNGIFRANVLLQNLEERSNILTDPILPTRLKAEARFLRAFFYFDLLRYFGEVPLITKPVLAAEALTIPRSPVSEVYDLIISDLKFAADSLPATFGTAASKTVYLNSDRGRATKFAAKGLLALVHMTRSGPTYNLEGPGLGLNEWSLALPLLNEVLAAPQYSFVSNYANIFSYTNENNPEVIFDIQYSTGFNPIVGATFPWVLVPDTYFQSQGKAVQGGLTIRPVASNLVNSYAANDVRKAFNIYTAGYTFNNQSESRPFIKKYVDITRVPANRTDWPINFIVLRYTDIMMLKAECILRGAPGSQLEVDAIVNQVRNRAGLTLPLVNVTLPQLMEERRREFAGEGLRWHDLVRSGLVTTVIPAWMNAEDTAKQMQTFVPEYIIYPVPQSELDAAPGLYQQNKGY